MALTRNKSVIPGAQGLRFAIVASRYNHQYVDSMLCAAEEVLALAHAKTVKIVRVPGAFEIPVAAARLARSGKFDAVMALALILRGETLHAEHIGLAVSHGLTSIAIETGVPQVHEVVIADNVAQARKRCLDKRYNKGLEAAVTAIQIARTIKEL